MTLALYKKRCLNPLPKFLSSFHSLITDKVTISGLGIICRLTQAFIVDVGSMPVLQSELKSLMIKFIVNLIIVFN